MKRESDTVLHDRAVRDHVCAKGQFQLIFVIGLPLSYDRKVQRAVMNYSVVHLKLIVLSLLPSEYRLTLFLPSSWFCLKF